MKFTINGLSVNTFGKPENKPIIFIHGFPLDFTMWQNQIDVLKEDYYCIAYDVRGLGESYVGDGQYTMEFYVEDLFSIIEGLQLQKPALCGLSMGGYIGLRAAERNQELFGALILCDTKSDADDNAAKLKRSSNINMINTEGIKKFIDNFIPNCLADETIEEQKELFDSILNKSYQHNPTGVKGAILAIMSRTDTSSFLPQIKIPTLILCGSFDKLTPPQVMRSMSEKIPDSEFAIIPRAGHFSPLENPEAVNDLIKGFLKRKF